MKKALNIFIKLGLVIIMLAAILFLASKVLEQKIVEKAITVMNSKLQVPIYVEEISFSLLHKFPDATLRLKNVTLLSAENFNQSHFNQSYTDTLLFFKELYLSVNLVSLYYNKLEITKAYAEKGQINLLIDLKGLENYQVLSDLPPPQKTAVPDRTFEFLLNQIQLKQVDLRYINKFKMTAWAIYAPQYTVKGKFYKKEYTANSRGKLFLRYFEQGALKMYPDNPTDIDLNLNVKNNLIEISHSSIQSKYLHLDINGSISLNDPMIIDLKVSGQTTNLNKLVELISPENARDFASQGQLAISAAIKGILNSVKSPAMAANFKLSQGSLHAKKLGVFLDSIEISGSYSNGAQRNSTSSQISLSNFKISMGNSALSGNLRLTDFTHPYVNMAAHTRIKLMDFDAWNTHKSNIMFAGNLEGDFECRGYYDSQVENPIHNYKNWHKKGVFRLNDASFRMRRPELHIADFSGLLSINNNTLSLTEAKGQVQQSMIDGDAILEDYFTPLVDSVFPVDMKINLLADAIHYNDFKHFFERDDTQTKSRTINVTGSFKSQDIYYHKLTGRKVSGNLSYVNDKLQITDLLFNTMEGTVSGNINYFPQKTNTYLFQTHTETQHVNIKTLLSTFNNFGQSFIIDDNLEGYLTSNFDLEMLFEKGSVVSASIELLGHARIDNGKLVNFEPIYEVSKYADMEALKNIEFSKLENDILISNSTLHIPQMDIESNAFDISLFGSQKFNGDYEYHLRIYVSDFIGGKTKRLAKQQSEFGYIEDDGFGKKTLYLLATSINRKSKVSLDGSEIKNNLSSGLKDETKEFKKALHDEFGWFKKDSTLNKTKKKPKKQEFIIEWDEE